MPFLVSACNGHSKEGYNSYLSLQHPPEHPHPRTPHCRDRIPAPVLQWSNKTFMIQKTEKAMAVLTAAIPVSLALTCTCSTGQTLQLAWAHYLAVGTHGGALFTPRSEFGLRFPCSSAHRFFLSTQTLIAFSNHLSDTFASKETFHTLNVRCEITYS